MNRPFRSVFGLYFVRCEALCCAAAAMVGCAAGASSVLENRTNAFSCGPVSAFVVFVFARIEPFSLCFFQWFFTYLWQRLILRFFFKLSRIHFAEHEKCNHGF